MDTDERKEEETELNGENPDEVPEEDSEYEDSGWDFEDRETERIKKENKEFLRMFKNDLTAKGLSENTIRQHLANVNFYINRFLLWDDFLEMEEGCWMLEEFLGNFFIRRCLWSTPKTIKTTAASIKKFYKCMLDHEKISEGSYKFLCSDIKDSMADWQGICAVYNDPHLPNPFWDF